MTEIIVARPVIPAIFCFHDMAEGAAVCGGARGGFFSSGRSKILCEGRSIQ